MSNDYKQIVWLASYPKSGNTWVRLFMDAYFLGELDINEIVTSTGDDVAKRYIFDDFMRDLWRAPVDIQQLVRGASLLRSVNVYQDTLHGEIPLFIKSHAANVVANGVELLPAALTKATIYIVRDPRDVLPSFCNHMGADIDDGLKKFTNKYQLLAATEVRVADYISDWGSHVESFLAAADHNVMLVHYEDLRAEPVAVFSAILQHAGVEPELERVEKAVELTKLSRLKKQEAELGFKEASAKAKDPFFHTGEIGKAIPAGIKSGIERAFRKTMAKVGYTRSKRVA